MTSFRGGCALVGAGLVTSAVASACGAPPRAPPAAPPRSEAADLVIVTATSASSARELRSRAEQAAARGEWAVAAACLEVLLAADPEADDAASLQYSLGTAYEGLADRPRAWKAYRALADRFPQSPYARAGLSRALALGIYLEAWADLEAAARDLLARSDLEPLERMLGLGARALARVEQGDADGASPDVQTGLDLVEAARVGDGGRLPHAAAQLRFALAEVRRLRSERIALAPADDAFGGRLEARCRGLLDAQSAYAASMHALDPHWAAMAGYRVGEMYRTLHRDVMAVPMPDRVRTEGDHQIFYASMHLRYRVLLEKGLKMMRGTLDVATQTGDGSPWVQRAAEARDALEQALAEERARIATFPFTEAEMARALELLVAPPRPGAAGARTGRPGPIPGRPQGAPRPAR